MDDFEGSESFTSFKELSGITVGVDDVIDEISKLPLDVNGKVKVYQLWENKSVPPRGETTCAYEGGTVISSPPC